MATFTQTPETFTIVPIVDMERRAVTARRPCIEHRPCGMAHWEVVRYEHFINGMLCSEETFDFILDLRERWEKRTEVTA